MIILSSETSVIWGPVSMATEEPNRFGPCSIVCDSVTPLCFLINFCYFCFTFDLWGFLCFLLLCFFAFIVSQINIRGRWYSKIQKSEAFSEVSAWILLYGILLTGFGKFIMLQNDCSPDLPKGWDARTERTFASKYLCFACLM